MFTTAVPWDGPGDCECPEPEICVPCEDLNVALPLEGAVRVAHLPAAYRLGQVLTSYTGPMLRVEGFGAGAGEAAVMSSAQAVASVRAHGIRALSVDVPGGGAGTRVTVRVYSITGRLVRVLVDEGVDPGSYVVGWDGEDAAGRAVQPGVYLAVMTAGGFHGVQRLLVK